MMVKSRDLEMRDGEGGREGGLLHRLKYQGGREGGREDWREDVLGQNVPVDAVPISSHVIRGGDESNPA